MAFCQLWLTCADKAEADKIASALLQNKLIACAKQVTVSSDFLWQGKTDHNDEILLVMDSHESLFEETEKVIARLHSYETFVLQSIPVTKINNAAREWLGRALKEHDENS